MEVTQFNKIASLITGRTCELISDSEMIELSTDYRIKVEEGFYWAFEFKSGKSYDNLINTFISQFTSKYKEQLPEFKGKKFYDLSHHFYSKHQLMEQIKLNFESSSFIEKYSKYGFYSTNYGIGIFSLLLRSDDITTISKQLNKILLSNKIKFHNEYSDKRWVYRWVINLDKTLHSNIIKQLSV